MIDLIEIKINNGPNSKVDALIAYQKKICYMNQKKYEVSDFLLERIKDIIFLWKNEYGSDNLIDSEEWTVKITCGKEEDIYHGKGVFPSNYQALLDILGGFDGREN